MAVSKIDLGNVKGPQGSQGPPGILDAEQLATLDANFDLISEWDTTTKVAAEFTPQDENGNSTGWTIADDDHPYWYFLPGGIYCLGGTLVAPASMTTIAVHGGVTMGKLTFPNGFGYALLASGPTSSGNVCTMNANGFVSVAAVCNVINANASIPLRIFGVFTSHSGKTVHGAFTPLTPEENEETEE